MLQSIFTYDNNDDSNSLDSEPIGWDIGKGAWLTEVNCNYESYICMNKIYQWSKYNRDMLLSSNYQHQYEISTLLGVVVGPS